MTPKEIAKIPGWCDFDSLYREAIESVPEDGLLIEIGVYQGRSLCTLATLAKEADKRQRVLGVDHFRGPHSGRLKMEAARIEAERNLERCAYRFAELWVTWSTLAATRLPDESVDFLFVDGSHDYHSVREDLAAWLPKMKPTGIMAGHDYERDGVQRAIHETFEEVEQVGNCWRVLIEIEVSI